MERAMGIEPRTPVESAQVTDFACRFRRYNCYNCPGQVHIGYTFAVFCAGCFRAGGRMILPLFAVETLDGGDGFCICGLPANFRNHWVAAAIGATCDECRFIAAQQAGADTEPRKFLGNRDGDYICQ